MTFSPTIGEWFISSTIFGAAARKGQVIMVKEAVLKQYGKSIAECTDREVYDALLTSVNELAAQKESNEGKRKLYYISAEFLIGKLLSNNLINLGLYDEVKAELNAAGRSLAEIEEIEPEPSLGNGGLGRLAACFLDSLSTMEYPAYGCGIRYHYGIFEQQIDNGYQVERPDNWLANGDFWSIKRSEYEVEVKFGGDVRTELKENGELKFIQENYSSVIAVPYDYPVIGYGNNTVNTLRLWEARPKNFFDLQSFNAGNYAKALEEQNIANTITEVLYPADEHIQGKELRLRQQYFFISATVQRVIDRFKKDHSDFKLLPEKVAFQLNDTHPSIAVAELMRVLVDENDVPWDEAWEITTKVCAYTNHTIMSEALEKWPIELFSRLLPRIYMIIEEINRRFCIELVQKYGNNPSKIHDMSIIADGQIKMAYLAIVGSHSVNGVARLHTEILKNQELKNFYEFYPKKFNNKTNGITQRRWLLHANRPLAELISSTIGDKWITDLDELNKLLPYADDSEFRVKFMAIKRENKKALAQYIKETNGIDVDPESIYDIQVKRLHEYKRQLLNVFHIIDLYFRIKANPSMEITPRTFIFGAKAAAGYKRAKDIIKLINSVADVVNNDPDVAGRIKVVFMANYCVSLAEKLIPAADVSEQISTAGKEASGTGNMKFMLNGAVTIGTMDGANVEIYEEVGADNIIIFGLSSEETARMSSEHSYNPWDVYHSDERVRRIMESLVDGTFSPSNPDIFRDIYYSLLGNDRSDEYFVLKDFASYVEAQERLEKMYKDKEAWAKMAVINTAKSGKFSSDRTIKEYAEEIWNLKPLHIEL